MLDMTRTLSKNNHHMGGHKFSKYDGVSPEDRFWAKVDKTPGQGPDGDCWGWLACTANGGYGYFKVDGKLVRAHRFSYEIHHGPIPEDKKVRHSCDNPPCSNPDHLLLGVDQDNVDDRVRRGRSARGEHHGSAKLTSEDIFAIRRDLRPHQQIAADYDVSHVTIYKVKRGIVWGHIVRHRSKVLATTS